MVQYTKYAVAAVEQDLARKFRRLEGGSAWLQKPGATLGWEPYNVIRLASATPWGQLIPQ